MTDVPVLLLTGRGSRRLEAEALDVAAGLLCRSVGGSRSDKTIPKAVERKLLGRCSLLLGLSSQCFLNVGS